ETFHHRPREPGTRRERRARDVAAADSDDPLLASLKALRLKLAKERRLPAYLIFSDRTLLDMAARRPRNEEEFAAVNGVGAAKLQEFATPFITAIAAHEKRVFEESSPSLSRET